MAIHLHLLACCRRFVCGCFVFMIYILELDFLISYFTYLVYLYLQLVYFTILYFYFNYSWMYLTTRRRRQIGIFFSCSYFYIDFALCLGFPIVVSTPIFWLSIL
ncbi:uncharacterized protein V1516DRAFT_343270 [Lipomyces oligophaga]|uniref:uncharacterized protein n=1 Tax=Lipomyces oligophaga TaxID=45792 RepID=UPI0034CE1F8C